MAREQGPRPARRADQRLGALRPAPAAPRAAEPGLQRHQVHPGRQGAARRAPARRQRQRAGVRYRPRHPAGQALHHLQGVPAPGGDGQLGARAWGSGFPSSSASARCCDHPVAAGVDAGARLGVLGRPAARRAERWRRWRPSRRRQPVGPAVRPRVVCIDNEPAVLQGMQALLSGWGCTVITARSGGRRAGAAAQGRTTAGYHPGRLPPRRGNRDRSHCGAARRHAAADPGHHHHRRSLRRGAAGSPPQGPRPAEKTARRRRRLRALMHQLTWRRRAVAAE